MISSTFYDHMYPDVSRKGTPSSTVGSESQKILFDEDLVMLKRARLPGIPSSGASLEHASTECTASGCFG